MKKKELQGWKTKKQGELEKEIHEKRKKLAEIRVDLAMGKVKNIREVRELKQTLAQLLSIQNSNKKDEKLTPRA